MNRENAKVPDVEGDWQSIEIFLFSNGQQYSPPRKYLLRVDELNLWDATLKLLAQSQYGLQNPVINLYTTNGHLVKGPLDLRDGQAYVAVTPPDTFIDAGYQKYLIRASRSWEKRQARKKPPECVPDEPCCLCPEKERSCCDPQACCLCPKKEDEDSMVLLLPETVLPKLSTAGSPYMSSAPAKPVAVDDDEPVSGKIGRMTYEHCENRAGLPGEFGHSKVPATDKQNEYRAGFSENRANLTEDGVRTNENVEPVEYRSKLGKNANRPDEYGARQSPYDTRPSLNEARPGENVVKPDEYARQGIYETRSSVNGTGPVEYETKPSSNGNMPRKYEAKPGEYGARPAEYETKPSVNGATEGEYGARLAEYGARPGEYGTRPNINGAKPGEHGARPGIYETRPGVNGSKPPEYVAKSGEYESRQSVNRSRPGEFGARSTEYETKPSANGTKPDEYGARRGKYETRPRVNGARQGEYEAILAEYEAGLEEYETRSNLNGERSAEYEEKPRVNGAKPVDYDARPGEYETRPYINAQTEYDTRPGEYKARPGEYETRPYVNGTRQTEYETRPGECKARPGEYESKSNINGTNPDECAAKQGEYETRSSINGTRPSEFGAKSAEYGARPGEYEDKPTTNGSKPGGFGTGLGEYGSRLAKCETRPSEYGAKLAEYETKPNVNGAKPGEHGIRQGEYRTRPSEFEAKAGECATRSAEKENKPDEYRPSPAKNGPYSRVDGDRMTGHKTRPGYSGPRSSKIEPIKEVYEITLRENNKSFDENEDRPDKDTVDKDGSLNCATCLKGENVIEKKGEYKTREGDKKDKKNEPKDKVDNRSSGNGRSGGERRVSGGEKNIRDIDTVRERTSESRDRNIENAHRLSGHAGAETEQGGRTGEPSRGFEHGGRVSAQKGRETNLAVRAGGPGARENLTRLSEQRNRQNDNLVRLGGRESRVGDHEARAGDLGFPIHGNDAGLGNPRTRAAVPGVKAAVSGAQASPRDKISSRAKTGNSGQPKIGTPGTRVDEALVTLDDPNTKIKEVTLSGARQSRVGGIGAAGALHISEAQQHARRISLSAGRPSIEKKRLSIGQNSSLLRKPNPSSSILRKPEDKQPTKPNKENLTKKNNEKASIIPVPASNDSEKSKTQPKSQPTTPLPLPTSHISITNGVTLTTNEVPLENVTDEKEIIVISTHSFKDPESETKSMRLDSVKNIVDAIDYTQEETQTQMIYVEKSMAYVSVNEGVQTSTEEVEQREQEVTASSKEKINSCTCSLCRPINHRVASDPDENTLSMLNKGGVVNIKLNIEVRNIVKSVYSCQKNCGRSRSLTNITRSEKESQISIDNDVVVHTNSLQSLFTKQNFRGFGFDGSPNVMVVQCDGCGRLNNPSRCEPPPCCDSNKKYFVLLNSVLEDMEDGCNFNPPCRPCDQRQSKKQSTSIPTKQAFSETTLDTITTVTVSGVPLQRREIGKYATNISCQTEEPQNECMMAKRKVSITQDSVTRSDLQKRSSSSICVETQAVSLVPKQSCLKICLQKCEQEDSLVCSEPCPTVRCSQVPPPTCEKVQTACSQVPPVICEKIRSVCSPVPPTTCEKVLPICSQVAPPTCEILHSHVPPPTYEKVRSICSHVAPPTCEKVRSTCSHVPPPTCEKVRSASPQVSSQTCPQVQKGLKGCHHINPQLQSQGCMPMSPTCPPCCPKTSPPGMQVQTHACLQAPQYCNAETQTRWASILARLHCDGRYSFHLPPLHLLKNNYSCCQ